LFSHSSLCICYGYELNGLDIVYEHYIVFMDMRLGLFECDEINVNVIIHM
jgi:hypothetical protein